MDKTKISDMTTDEILNAATDYVARQEFDSCQIFTNEDCALKYSFFKDTVCAQVWVMLPKQLEKADW